MNFIRFLDSVNLKPLNIPEEVKDYYEQAARQGLHDVRPLRVRIAATHAGKVTRNNSFYLPHKMREGVPSFIAQYNKPIQIHHQDKEDPIGRVIQANYVDISVGVRDSLKDSIDSEQEKKIGDFVAGNLSIQDSVDFANTWIINDMKISTNPDYEGLGYAEIIANISDPDAIQKILDGRYLTGSVGATTNSAICSVCKKDWANEGGPCEHRPGKIYDGAKCVMIAGDLSYDEYSFVNKPADRHSRIIEVNLNGVQDFVTCEEEEKELATITLVVDKVEDNKMTFEAAISFINQQERFKDISTLSDDIKKIIDEHKELTEEELVSLLDNTYKKEEDPVKDFFGEEYEALTENTEEGRHYVEMLYSLIESAKTEEERTAAIKLVTDAKLSSAQRKKLSSSTFCGPDRSFPVPDCAHYSAALRLIGRYKGPGDKNKIRACVERKGARLGCTSKKEESAMEDFTVESLDKYSNEDIVKMFDILQEVMKERKMECGCQQKDVSDEVQKQLSELKEKLDSSRKEVRYLHEDLETVTNSVAEQVKLVYETRIKHITDMRRLTGEDVTLEQVSDELKEKTGEELAVILTDLTGKVDTSKIIGILNSGLSNNPVGTVDDPTLVQDNTKVDNKLSDSKKRELRLQWLQIRTSHGKKIADNWLSETCKTFEVETTEIVPVKE